MQTNVLQSGMISIKDFNPSYHSGEGVYQQKSFSFPAAKMPKEKSLQESIETLRGKVDVYSYKYDDDLFIPVNINPEKEEKAEEDKYVRIEKEEKPVLVEIKKSNGPQYIVGAYSNSENAKSMVELLHSKGMSGAKIVDNKGGLSRVSAGGSENMIELDAIAEKAEAAGYKGWILK
jgi:cell division septation protein DedD